MKLLKTIYVLLISMLAMSSIASECTNKDNICLNLQVNSHAGEALEDMIVYLEPLSGQQVSSREDVVVIDQHNKSFSPYISVSQVNSKVNFSNRDDITHHIYSANTKNKFSFKIRAGQTNDTIAFEKATDIAMGCNIHDWMSGYLLIVDTPYFTKTNDEGRVTFSIEHPGKYQIVVWHPQMTEPENRVSVIKNISADQSFTLALTEKMADIPIQENEEDFDFLSDYE